jgi:glucose-1-phosphate adenylyltransferase
LFPLTAGRPKPAVPFGGLFRIVDFTLFNCLRSGLTGLRLLTQYKHEYLHQYLLQRRLQNPWGSEQHDEFLCLPPARGGAYRGTADAVFQNLDFEEPLPEFVLILSADHIYTMDYREMLQQHLATGADLTIGTVERPLAEASRYGVVNIEKNSRIDRFEEKPAHPQTLPDNPEAALVSMGIYVFKTVCLLQALQNDAESEASQHDFARDIIPRLIESAQVYSYDFWDPVRKTPRYWRDIGTLDSYYQASMDLVSPKPLFDPFRERWSGLRRGARVRGGHVRNSVISPGVRVEEGAEVEDAVLMPGVRVGARAQIRRAIVQESVYVPAGSRIGFDLESDSKRYFVTDTGIVVVSEPTQAIHPVRSRCHVPVLIHTSPRLSYEHGRRRRARAS